MTWPGTVPGRGCTASPPTWPARTGAARSATTARSPADVRLIAPSDEDAIADRVSASAAGPALASALAALDRSDRDVLLLVALADLSYAEVAESLGIPYGTVCSRLSRVRRRLRESLGGEPGRDRRDR
jgi:RNA polymerase sigma factor (sigma-70 family)